MRFTPKRYRMMRYMLSRPEFGLRELAAHIGVSFGATVSDFVGALGSAGFVDRSGSRARGGRRYRVISPVGLVSFYSKFRRMRRLACLEVGESREQVMARLAGLGATFCLVTALERYDSHFLDRAVYAYMPEEGVAALQYEAKWLPRKGRVYVELYHDDLAGAAEGDVVEHGGARFTSEVRTVIDLYCRGKAHAAEDFVRAIW